MKRDDHILALTHALLTSHEQQFSTSLGIVSEIYEIQEARKPGRVSLGATADKVHVSFTNWIAELRQAGVEQVSFSYYVAEQHDLSPHVAAAFAGSSALVMQVTTSQASVGYVIRTFYSPSYEITPAQFIEIMDSQPDRHLAWARAAELILESNKLNQRTIFDPSQTAHYLTLPEGGEVFDFLVSELVKEIQIEHSIHNVPFVIPEKFTSLFVKHKPLFAVDDEREYVFLYPLRDVTAGEVLTLSEAQSFEPLIWEELNRTLEQYQDENLPPMPVNEWKGKLMSMDAEKLQQIVHPICRSICTLCEAQKLKPVIPAALAAAFGPSEEDQQRAAARSKGEKDRWNLQRTQQAWEYYEFQIVEHYSSPAVVSVDMAGKKFNEALNEIRTFSEKIQSPFAEAFRLAQYVMEESFLLDGLKQEAFSELSESLKADGFSDRAIEVLSGKAWLAGQFMLVGSSPERIKGLLAVSVADVFGGMGSWNDQYVEQQDYEQYQAVSAALFQALKDYFAAVLSIR